MMMTGIIFISDNPHGNFLSISLRTSFGMDDFIGTNIGTKEYRDK